MKQFENLTFLGRFSKRQLSISRRDNYIDNVINCFDFYT